jgi:hypothetical protein
MDGCYYSAQGELLCRTDAGIKNRIDNGTRKRVLENFIRSGTTYEPYYNLVNTRPNEVNAVGGGFDATMTPEIIKAAIANGCSVTVDKTKGYSITNCGSGKMSSS